MSKRYKADATTIKGCIEALQAAYERRLYFTEHTQHKVKVSFNASTFGLYIDQGIDHDKFGWFKGHDLWIETKGTDNE